MNASRWGQIQEIFNSAIERPPAERASYIAAATDDPVLSDELLSLLRAHDGRGPLDSIADQLHGLRAAAAAVPLAGLLARLRSALGDRYRVERELGRGGMAIVLLADDLKHHRKVALKLLQPDLALDIGPARFLQEIAIAARLTHPHILPLHDSGEADGLLYYVMPYVEGESLRDRLRREGRFSLAQALEITRQVGGALSYAHSRGVIHRDIKPENILFEADHAVVSDFGIARAMTAAGGDEWAEAGLVLGTPAYMSPEQTAGANVDGRSDIYSLGCVLYEMLAGEPPFAGATAEAVLRRHRTEHPAPLKAMGVSVPQGVAAAIERALAKQPAHRFATAADLTAALGAAASQASSVGPRRRRIAVAAVLVTVAALGAAVLGLPGSGQSVAVLPLVNMTGDPANEFLTDGISEELINAFVQIPRLRVPARTSSFSFKGKDLSLRQIGESLKVANVLEGSIRKAGERLRITTQLVRVADGGSLWSETYDREQPGSADLFAVEEEIAEAIVSALHVRLAGAAGTRVVPRYTANREAHELFLKGRYFFHRRTPEDMNKAIRYFEQAIARDSTYALGYSGLADAYVLAGSDLGYLPPEQVLPNAKTAALGAVALDSTLAEAQTSLARIRMTVDRDFVASERAYRRAIALKPNYTLAHSWYALMLTRDGTRRFDDAVREGYRAAALDPLSPSMNHNLAIVLIAAARYSEAIVYARKAVELQPDWVTAHMVLGNAYLGNGMLKEARAEYQQTLAAMAPSDAHVPNVLAGLGHVYAMTGNRPEALEILQRLSTMPRDAQLWRGLAILYGALGEMDSAFAALERARQAGWIFGSIGTSHAFDPLRADPRFAEFVRKLSAKQ